ncbi:conserved hypothetical protein [Planktothrix serta PCC 8927]|uniref:DUF2281 domain-containing protein n=1 Tax=Planktothrix serta PCC 8927 TaxID=671068 RepID=A0A7Z9E284_9CYAN|nr:hypothetical protein [Planktothrix serta]VXD23672.1 conserved hypothetical protein [Planktothrix serta PCC 8927]
MTSKDQLIQELENLPDQLIDQVLDYIAFIKHRHFLQLEKQPDLRTSLNEDWWDNLSRFTPDFLDDREQPNLPQREDIFL